MKPFRRALAAAAIGLAAGSAGAVQVLDFEGIAPYPNNSDVLVQGFYNGGTSSIGTTGANLGIEFSDNALMICLNTLGIVCAESNTSRAESNTSRGGLGNPASRFGSLFFLTGTATRMNRVAGFAGGFSFNYAAVNSGGGFTVWDGLNGTGNVLGSLDLPITLATCDGDTYGAAFCPFVPTGLSFAGTAHSVTFSGVSNQIVFDDVTFGSSVPGIPEPATYALVAAGLAAVGCVARRRRTLAAIPRP